MTSSGDSGGARARGVEAAGGIDGAEGWRPSAETTADTVWPAAAEALHGLLDAPGSPPLAGDSLPPLWHWLAFLPRVPQGQLGPDGHPRRGGFLPPVRLPRRMFAGGQLSFTGSLRVGSPIARIATVDGVETKTGRSGSLVFIKVGYKLHDRDITGPVAVTENQDIVYRDMPSSATPAPSPASGSATLGASGAANPASGAAAAGDAGALAGPDGAGWDWGFDLAIEPTLLFRFSALTYNAHRIHYDRTYATEVEGYPGLVVHGPLQAIALAELCRRYQPNRVVAEFRFRALAPAFDDGPLLLRGGADATDPSRAILAAFDHRGRQTMHAETALE